MALSVALTQSQKGSERTAKLQSAAWGSVRVQGLGGLALLKISPFQVTLTKPSAPNITFGVKHSDYMTPLVVDVE